MRVRLFHHRPSLRWSYKLSFARLRNALERHAEIAFAVPFPPPDVRQRARAALVVATHRLAFYGARFRRREGLA